MIPHSSMLLINALVCNFYEEAEDRSAAFDIAK